MTWLMWLVLVLCLLAVAAIGLSGYGAWRWANAAQALLNGLDVSAIDAERRGPPRATRYNASELVGLPAPVQRYFRAVLTDGQPIINAVTVDIAGTFNLSPTGEQWSDPLGASRTSSARSPH